MTQESVTSETPPQFPGGMDVLKKKLFSEFDTSKIDTPPNGNLPYYRTDLTITIDEDGNVKNIKSEGNNDIFEKEADRLARKVFENLKWTPAIRDGKPIASQFRIPFVMTFSKGNPKPQN